ncbi:peptidase C13 [Sphingomonas sp. Leaf339]|uniref:C13 family peptidase n=1 Tax=Sphingomonas sp. Leaf339 TaxID=1736343 RepID=UPI0007011D62|nr:C13 family peptidase [Sphingomonas sp. Leaf339]KQU61869.1 peptidase C13 [Sphingomonas sp. Leaf339]
MMATARIGLLVAILLTASAPLPPPQARPTAPESPPVHAADPPLFDAATPEEAVALADGGVAIEHGRTAASRLAQYRRLEQALGALAPQRPGVVDAYVVTIALDSDPVFSREAREAGAVLARRYDAANRTIVLGGADGRGGPPLAMGSPASLDIALARIAELMDLREDVLVLYVTSHGAPIGLVYNDGDQGYGVISPTRLWTTFSQLGIGRRLVLVSACFSGVFVSILQSADSAIVTASSADRTSFGCQADSDWTFFGDALVNHALRKPQPLDRAASEAQGLIAAWERQGDLEPSGPQVAIGAGATRWLVALDARGPKEATSPVGRPAVSMLND